MGGQAYKYNQLDDDPIMSDGSAAFTGIVTAVNPRMLEASELAGLTNGDIGAYGTAGMRPPARLIANNLSDDFYVSHDGVAYDGYGLRYVGKDYISDTQKIWAFKGTTPKIFFFVEGKLYLADSLSAETWSEPAIADINPNSVVSAAQLAGKAYFVDESKLRVYEESDNKWTFAEVAKFRKHSTDGETLIDGEPIPPASCIETHVERLCMAGISDAAYDPATVFFSDYLDGKTWLITESIQVGSDGDAIIALKSWRNNTLLVFKAGSVWAIVCDPLVDDSGNKLSPAYWTVNKISDSYGVVARETIAQVGNDVWFLSKRGVCSVQRAVAADENEMQALPISTPIQNYIDRINWEYAYRSSAVYFKDRYFLSIPIDGAMSPNVVLVYNTIMQKWQGVWDGTAMRATGYTKVIENGIENLVWRTHDGTAYRFIDDDNESAYDLCEGYQEYFEQCIITKSYVWEAPFNQKRALEIELEFYDSKGVAALFVNCDGKGEIPVAENMAISTAKHLPLKLPFSLCERNTTNFKYNLRTLPRFREIQVIIKTRNGRARLRNININAIVMPV